MSYTTIVMLIILIGAIFFMQRSQRKQAQERQNQLNAIAKGDEVITIGGLYATVDEVDAQEQKLVLDVDGVYLPFEMTAIKRVVQKAGQTAEEERAQDQESSQAIETSQASQEPENEEAEQLSESAESDKEPADSADKDAAAEE
ncbi:preprotein translocase subunit YajC [Streptococcus macacae]|uniref:Preprotein translocase, YajC subunit n=1 Tax=Streptococcus macacae NCTC 11558 TaxID=764298 RepID=G5JWV1_9STRE|nr:preprotein translocase subunit YajC [Streptococcus macacae]EHJ52074.1 preprotein translocase, YajC subunit [Streptococcus macacae NCTC 11558]SUN79059.1 preprotein translocase subunit YajC [Streptococcus macacae NCTC 11558]